MKALGGEFLEICCGIKGVSVSNASSEVANLNMGASVSQISISVCSRRWLCVCALHLCSFANNEMSFHSVHFYQAVASQHCGP
jgi:hypothetical protein